MLDYQHYNTVYVQIFEGHSFMDNRIFMGLFLSFSNFFINPCAPYAW